ncbi:MAG: rhomboid family intramembrane serine protease [Dehalococcoidia bacterium]|nr:rhomboid family intramembrane serine protease [Dehalococcoidia bacterium]
MIPIRTETSVRHTPVANLALLVANVLVFLLLDYLPSASGREIKNTYFVLDGFAPRLYQFITYQFAHGDAWHLAGNMLFLWVFGNSVNAKMGDIAYLLFYLAGGACAGLVFNYYSPHSLLGASGAIAAVTTAYLVLFPRSRVTVLVIFFFITFIEVPALLIIGVKIILWDNVVAPSLGISSESVAYSAHLAGYVFGFVAAMTMLFIRAIPRDQYDMLALVKRWNQRRSYQSMMSDPQARAQAQLGRVGKAAPVDPKARAEWNRQVDERTELRSRIGEQLARGEVEGAVRLYEDLIAKHPEQCLPAEQQIVIGRYYYSQNRQAQAAATFERYLASYAIGSEANEVRLLLGILLGRDLQQYERAEKLLSEALAKSTNPSRRALAEEWLTEVRTRRPGGPQTAPPA